MIETTFMLDAETARMIGACEQRAAQYANAYPNVSDDETREAIYVTHLTHLINNSEDVTIH